MTRAEAIEVLRGHARAAVCTLESRDCAELVKALTAPEVTPVAHAGSPTLEEPVRESLKSSEVSHGQG